MKAPKASSIQRDMYRLLVKLQIIPDNEYSYFGEFYMWTASGSSDGVNGKTMIIVYRVQI